MTKLSAQPDPSPAGEDEHLAGPPAAEATASSASPPPDPSPAPVSVGRAAAGGVAWFMAQSVLVKIASLASQLIVARLLIPDDFGLIAKAFAVVSLFNVLQEVGLKELLIQRHDEFDQWSRSAFWMSAACGLLNFLLPVALAPAAARWFSSPELVGLIVVVAAAGPLNALAVVPLARLHAQLRFRFLASLSLAVQAGMIVLGIVLAWRWRNAYALAWPWPALAAVRLVVAWAAARGGESERPRPDTGAAPPGGRWRALVQHSRTFFVGRACQIAINQADYIVLGLLYADTVVGIYYFAFNLSMQTTVLLAGSLESVLFPALSKLGVASERQRLAFQSAAEALTLIGVPLCLLQAGLADPLLQLFFPAKWYGSIPVLQILSVGMAARLTTPPVHNLLQAQTRYRTYMVTSVIALTSFVAFIYVGARLGAAVGVAAGAAAYFILEGPGLYLVATRPAGGRVRDVWRALGVPFAAAGVAVSAGVLLSNTLPGHGAGRHWLRIVVTTAVTAAVYLPLVWVLSPQACQTLVGRVRQLVRR